MDRISALRNVEDALSAYERGDLDLDGMEERVLGVLRTYATEFDGDRGLAAYRASGDGEADGVVVVAESEADARERVASLVDAEEAEFDLEHVG